MRRVIKHGLFCITLKVSKKETSLDSAGAKAYLSAQLDNVIKEEIGQKFYLPALVADRLNSKILDEAVAKYRAYHTQASKADAQATEALISMWTFLALGVASAVIIVGITLAGIPVGLAGLVTGALLIGAFISGVLQVYFSGKCHQAYNDAEQVRTDATRDSITAEQIKGEVLRGISAAPATSSSLTGALPSVVATAAASALPLTSGWVGVIGTAVDNLWAAATSPPSAVPPGAAVATSATPTPTPK